MYSIEKLAISIRRSSGLRNFKPLWDNLRPTYMRLLSKLGTKGLERHINGTDIVKIAPELYNIPEEYEPAVWRSLMAEIREGDRVADVGTYIGLYTIAFGKRVGQNGCVFAFEPDPDSRRWLECHIELNDLHNVVQVFPNAVGDHVGQISFVRGRKSESHVTAASENDVFSVPLTTLDSAFYDTRLDVLKVDVEGFEEFVVRGAQKLLRDPDRAPRVIFIEVHPFAWSQFGVTSDSLLNCLHGCGYSVFDLNDNPITTISEYGEVIARSRVKRS